ncbi:MAG: DUF5455 family protein [Piscirickettsiaceae bacterium]|nr:DUF5455 family protein [Piscirickettsiaceae bacterium]
MPIFLWGIFTSLATYFAQFLGKRLTIVAAAITAFTSVLLAFKVAIDAAIAGIAVSLPSGAFLFGFGLLPDNTSACLTAMTSAYVGAQVYVYWRNIIAFRLVN